MTLMDFSEHQWLKEYSGPLTNVKDFHSNPTN